MKFLAAFILAVLAVIPSALADDCFCDTLQNNPPAETFKFDPIITQECCDAAGVPLNSDGHSCTLTSSQVEGYATCCQESTGGLRVFGPGLTFCNGQPVTP